MYACNRSSIVKCVCAQSEAFRIEDEFSYPFVSWTYTYITGSNYLFYRKKNAKRLYSQFSRSLHFHQNAAARMDASKIKISSTRFFYNN
jgi:hypothetical protein